MEAWHEEIFRQARRLRKDAWRLYDDLAPRERASPWDNEQDIARIRSTFGKVERLMQISGVLLENPSKFPPAFLAVLLRRLDNEPNPRTAFERLVHLAEVALRYDVAMLCSTLALLDEKESRKAFDSSDAKRRRGEWHATFGQWRMIQRRLRDAFKRKMRPDSIADPLWRRLCQELCDVDETGVSQACDRLIEARNTLHGHGSPRSDAFYNEVACGLRPTLDRFIDSLAYLQKYPLLHVDRVCRGRESTVLQVRMLVHDSAEFTREEWRRPKGTRFDDVRDREVYLSYADPDRLMSLHPWVIVAEEPSTKNEALWMFVGVEEGEAVYESSHVPEGKIKFPSGHKDLALMTGLALR